MGEISIIALPRPGRGFRVLTSVSNRRNRLRLIVWDISEDGTVTRRGKSGEHGYANRLRSTLSPSGHVVVSYRKSTERLTISTWTVSSDGLTVTRRAHSGRQAGNVEDHALMPRPDGVVSGVMTRRGTKRLKLISWQIASDGSISRLGDSQRQARRVSGIWLCQEPLDGDSPIVTTCRTLSGKLKLITWTDQPWGGLSRGSKRR